MGALDDEVLRSRPAEESELCLNCCASLICYFPLTFLLSLELGDG